MSWAADVLRAWIPRWWRGEAGRLGRAAHVALGPAEAGFGAVSRLRNRAYDRRWLRARRAPIPVISVGNISVGGAGKTPVSAWIAERLLDMGGRPAIVMRGYGADEVEVHRELNPGIPVFAAPRRIDGTVAAARAGRDVAVLDDGFQHRGLARDVDIVLVAAESWTPERHLLPRGPWREPGQALARADLVLVTRKTADPEVAAAVARECAALSGGPVAICHLAPERLLSAAGEPLNLSWLHGRHVVAVTSLAEPGPFVRQLEALGAHADLLAYPDHHAFTMEDIADIASRAGGRPVVCTRKEAVKLRPLMWGPMVADLHLVVVHQGVVMESGGDALESRLLRVRP